MASRTPAKHSPLYQPLIWAALGLALTGGFGYATVLVAGRALGWPVSAIWFPLVQAHGHVQLFGWAGLFVIAVSLYFLPRLRGTPLVAPQLTAWVFGLLVGGLALRAVCQPALGALPPGPAARLAGSGFALSGMLELAAISLFVGLLVATGRRGRPLSERQGLRPVAPYLVTGFASLWLAGAANAWLVAVSGIRAAGGASGLAAVLPPTWDSLLVQLTLTGFLVPVALAFSIRTFPLYLTLPPLNHPELLAVFVAYLAGLVVRLAAGTALAGDVTPAIAGRLYGLGSVVEGLALLAFTWLLDVLLRRRQPWTVRRRLLPQAAPAGPGRRPTRGLLPDYGEYGRFEWLLVPAYVWLLVAAGVMLANGASTLLGGSGVVSPDAERHALAAGFVTLLILGMAARMLPGFAGRRLASPTLVAVTALLGNGAAILRVGPLLVAPWLDMGWAGSVSLLDGLTAMLSYGYAASGPVGWAAVACLALNLWRTLRATREPARQSGATSIPDENNPHKGNSIDPDRTSPETRRNGTTIPGQF